jgi:hypothetical protein
MIMKLKKKSEARAQRGCRASEKRKHCLIYVFFLTCGEKGMLWNFLQIPYLSIICYAVLCCDGFHVWGGNGLFKTYNGRNILHIITVLTSVAACIWLNADLSYSSTQKMEAVWSSETVSQTTQYLRHLPDSLA